MANPMVGISWSTDLVERSSEAGENALKYMRLVAEAGLVPVLLMPGASAGVMSRVDGLLLSGGADIAPRRYGQEPGADLGEVDQELDQHELELVAAARARQLPILGICRGQQLINTALGGTLHQHVLHPQWDGDPSWPVHQVEVLAGTHLHRVLGVERAEVNSGHHQAVDVIAPLLRASARSTDGLVEALEAEELLIMAVQWHPDEMPNDDISHRLMAGFAKWVAQ